MRQNEDARERARELVARCHQLFAHSRELIQQTSELGRQYHAHQERKTEQQTRPTITNAAARADEIPSSSPAPASLPILLIEDSQADIALFRKALTNCAFSCQVSVLTTRDELETFVRDQAALSTFVRPRLIVFDSYLPGIEAEEILATLHRLPALRHIPAILFSGLAEDAGQQRSMRSGATAFVRKPTDLQEFFACVADIVGRWGALQPANVDGRKDER
jgi:two-component system response regulator